MSQEDEDVNLIEMIAVVLIAIGSWGIGHGDLRPWVDSSMSWGCMALAAGLFMLMVGHKYEEWVKP